MSQMFRLPQYGLVDRSKPLSFMFDGRAFTGHEGDTLASALLANGVHLVGRSFKYHRPRGIVGIGAEEPNALVTLLEDAARRTPNLCATQVPLHDGLVAVSQNRYPNLRFDLLAVNDWIGRFLPAGFYYKTFMWPRCAWDRLFEPAIRAAAGLGVASDLPDPDRYDRRYAHCEILVIGGGPAGIAAALAAAESGGRVILCDDGLVMGGSLLGATGAMIDGKPADTWLTAALAALANLPNVRLLPRTTAFGYYAHNFLGLVEHRAEGHVFGKSRERLWHVRAREVVVAAGAIERPLVFPGNDRPGIMLAEAGRGYLQRFGVAVGKRVAVVTAHDAGWRTAHELHDAGIAVVLVDLRPVIDRPSPPFRVISGARIAGTKGYRRVRAVLVESAHGRERLACDAVLMCGGYTPSVHLVSQSRAKLVWREDIQAYVPGDPAEAERSAGACRGTLELDAALADGNRAGNDAVRAVGLPAHLMPAPRARTPHPIGAGGYLGEAKSRSRSGQKAFVDWQNDVTADDIRLAAREGFRSIEHVKRYTTTGMATDQGKLSNLNALAIAADATDRAIPEVGLTTFRAPFTPVSFGALAGGARGALFEPVRTTPIHDWAAAQGAVFEDVGQWRRARYFPRAGEDMDTAVQRECRAVRETVGLFDASTLGKIEIVGPDAAEFLNRLYVNPWSKLAVGGCRYGLLLREDGFIFDDGVVGRLAPDRFHVTTTTGGAARVMAMMEDYLQTEWPDLEVWLTSTTEQWSVLALQGPRSRDVLLPLVEGIDLSPDALPHMSIIDGRIGGVRLRLMRVSFTGELGFEVNVPSGDALTVWKMIWDQGRTVGMAAYGTEAMHVLRAEKGYIIVGQETDGTATPDDVGLSWAIGKRKADFIGKRSLARAAMAMPDRKQLVGLLPDDTEAVLEEGAQITSSRDGRPIGHVTSAYFSAALGRSIALAMIKGGRARIGERLLVPMPCRTLAATVTSSVFVDPEGRRLNV